MIPSHPLLPGALSLRGHTVAIFGAGRGIGAAVARACGALGARVLLSDLESPDATAAALRDDGVNAEATRLDITSRVSVNEFARVNSEVDSVIIAAGIHPISNWDSFEQWEDDCRRVLEVNLFGPIYVARAYIPGMIARGSGRIVVLGSSSADTGGLSKETQGHYVASKAGLHGLVRWLARKGSAHGVLVNAVSPGSTDTPINEGVRFDLSRYPLNRLAKPEEIAWPAAFLCTPAASYITGAVLDVNGGLNVR